MAVLEVIAASFAAISAAKDGIDLWNISRNRRQVAAAIENDTVYLPQGRIAALQLTSISVFSNDEELTDIFTGRTNRCRQELKKVVTGDHPDEFVDKAMTAYKLCVCKEINRLKSVSSLPPDWQQKWDDFNCSIMSLPRL